MNRICVKIESNGFYQYFSRARRLLCTTTSENVKDQFKKSHEEDFQLLTELSLQQINSYDQMLKCKFNFAEFFDEGALTILNNNQQLFKPKLKCIKCNKPPTFHNGNKTLLIFFNVVCSLCNTPRKNTNFI